MKTKLLALLFLVGTCAAQINNASSGANTTLTGQNTFQKPMVGRYYLDTTGVNSIAAIEQNLPYVIQASMIDPSGNWYIGAYNVIYKSTNQGATWTAATTTFAADVSFRMMYAAANGYLFASPETTTTTAAAKGLWRSTDAGANWTRVQDLSAFTQVSVWGFAEDSSGNLFGGLYCLDAAAQCAIVYKSTDHGGTWNTVYTDATGRHIHDIQVDSSDRIYATMGDNIAPWNTKKIIKSSNAGTSWAQIIASAQQMTSIIIIPGGARIFTSDAGSGGIYMTTDDVTMSQPLALACCDYGFWAKRDSATGYLYASFVTNDNTAQVTNIFQSQDLGASWFPLRGMSVNQQYGGSQHASNIFNSMILLNRTNNNLQHGIALNLGNYPTYGQIQAEQLCDVQKTPCLMGKFSITGQTATSTSQNFFTCAVAGEYQAIINLYVTSAGSAGTVQPSVFYNDGVAGQNLFGSTCQLNNTNGTGACQQNTIFHCAAGQLVSYTFTVTGAASSPVFAADGVGYRLQ